MKLLFFILTLLAFSVRGEHPRSLNETGSYSKPIVNSGANELEKKN